MDHNIVEILVLLMREYPEGAIEIEEFEPLTQDLIDRGYSQQEIETALFWFQNRSDGQEMAVMKDEYSSQSFRVLHDIERSVVTPQAYGYLIELRQLGLINLGELNMILEKALILGGQKVTYEDVKMLAAAQILDQDAGVPMLGQSYYINQTIDKIQ